MALQTASDPSAPIVEFRNISKTYDGISNVVEGLNLNIGEGEFVTLLGPSGSGKTTLLMMLAGFENPTEGEVVLHGQRLNSIPAFKRNMGVVFQSYALFPHMTVGQNVGYPLKQRSFSRNDIAEKVKEALETVHMGDFVDRFPAQLSGGQQQRIALARALVFKPDVVLMDEPLGALDKQLREHMQLEIKQLHETLGMTVIYVTHDQSEALTMSDRIAIFNNGDILQIGSPHEIYEEPNCSFVANFIGEINNFPGMVINAGTNGSVEVALDCGLNTRGLDISGAEKDMRINLAVRPERLKISHPGQADADAVRGTVTDRIYYGDHLRYQVDVTGCEDVTVQASLDKGAAFDKGAQIALSWDPQFARVLDVL